MTPPNPTLAEAFNGHAALRTYEMEMLGVSRHAISLAEKQGQIERIGRGLYRDAKAELSQHQSLIEVVKSSPKVRICLLSALRFHDLTAQNPHEVWVAIGRSDRIPATKYPRLRVCRFSGPAWEEGLQRHIVSGVAIPVYSVAKTVVDLFRYRNKVGINIALEALKEGYRDRRFTIAEIDHFAARLCMTRVMGPYLETLLA